MNNENTITTLKNQKEKTKSQAQLIGMLIKKEKGLLKKYKNITKFDEPVLFLIRRDRNVEFYEKATKGVFEFEDSEDQTRKITLNPTDQLRFQYGPNTFNGYILYEDEYTPLPSKPLITAQLIEDNTDKLLADIKKWKLEAEKLKLAKWGYIIGGLAILIGGYILYKIMIKPTPDITPTEQTILENATQQILDNATTITVI